MTWHRRRANRASRDANHVEIVAALKAAGRRVVDLGDVGGGVPDVLVGWGGHTVFLEIKTAKGALRPAQEEFRAWWAGCPVVVVRTVGEALAATGVAPP